MCANVETERRSYRWCACKPDSDKIAATLTPGYRPHTTIPNEFGVDGVGSSSNLIAAILVQEYRQGCLANEE